MDVVLNGEVLNDDQRLDTDGLISVWWKVSRSLLQDHLMIVKLESWAIHVAHME